MRSVHSFPFTIGRDVSGCVGAASERGKATARYMLHMCVKGRLVFVARGHGHLFEINFVLHHHFFEEAHKQTPVIVSYIFRSLPILEYHHASHPYAYGFAIRRSCVRSSERCLFVRRPLNDTLAIKLTRRQIKEWTQHCRRCIFRAIRVQPQQRSSQLWRFSFRVR